MSAVTKHPAVKFDPSSIPASRANMLAAATLKSVREYLAVPGNREKLDARIAAKNGVEK